MFAVTRGTDIPEIETKLETITHTHPSCENKTALRRVAQMEAVMNFVPTKRERMILENPVDPRIIKREIPWKKVTAGTPWNRIVAILRDPELAAVAMLSAIGLLVTVALLLAFPHFGEITQSVQQFL